MEKLIIDRAEWLTGAALRALSENRTGTLCHPQSLQKCCLGIYGKQIGLSESRLLDKSLLTPLPGIPTTAREWLTTALAEPDQTRFKTRGGFVEDALAAVNDGNYHPSRKEAAIKYLFKKYGNIDVTFTGTYAAGTARAKRARKETHASE